MAESANNENVKFFTITEFKSLIGAVELQVKRNPKTEKLFVSANGEVFKAQATLDMKKEMKFRVENDQVELACLINVNGGAETIGTL